MSPILAPSPEQILKADPISTDSLIVKGQGFTLELGLWATSVDLEMTMDGTSTVTVGLVEQTRGELLDAFADFFTEDDQGIWRLAKTNLLTVYGTTYVLREVNRGASTLDFVFYDQASEKLKDKKGARKVSRGQKTRAEFVAMLANEAGVVSFIPDKSERQATHDLAPDSLQTLRTDDSDVSRFDRTYPAHYIDQAAGKKRLTPAQVQAIAESVGLPGLAFEQIAHGESGYYPGVVQRDPGDGNIGYGLWQITPHAWNGDARLLAKLERFGGVNGMRNPVRCAQMAKVLYDASGLRPWYGTKYLTSQAKSLASTPTADTGAVDRAYVQRYEFTRGQRENSWDAIGRLGNDVQWRRFAVFNQLIYASDNTLANIPTPYAFRETDEWVDSATWTCTASRKIDELVIDGRIAGILPPGAAVAIKDNGPTYGTWLVRNFRRDLLDPLCVVEVTLGRPQAPLPEPASSVVTRPEDPGTLSADDASESVRAAYAFAVRVAKRNYAYKFGGGHGSFSGPYDCSGFVSAVLHAAGLLDTQLATGGLLTWGEPGRGKTMTVWVHETGDPHQSHTFLTFNVGNGEEIFEAGGSSGQPTGRRSSRSFDGFVPRHAKGT